jgi:cellulose synthase/poly-beta-1,6-N-acetylglucosamine synthase-like glycosyltransferase
VTVTPLLATIVMAAVVYLLLAYAVGGPFIFLRELIAALGRRRLRYRGHPDDVLANSRFTIPASILLPAAGEQAVGDAVANLLALNYPEFEVIVVTDGRPALLTELRDRFGLRACEVFFRRSLDTGPVNNIYRSVTDHRLLVVDCRPASRGDALNYGLNLARFRYICCADPGARYKRDSLLECMQPATEDPAVVMGVTTLLGTADESTAGIDGVGALLHRLGVLRGLLGRGGGRRLSLSPGGLPGFTLWRRDVAIEVGGFAADVPAEHADMTFRVHRHMLRERRSYRIIHVSESVGSSVVPCTVGALAAIESQRQQSMVRILWRARRMLLNPAYGRVGLIDFPRYVLSALVVPWLELTCLLLLPFAALVGALTAGQLVVVVLAIALGNGVMLNTAMAAAPLARREDTLVALVLLGPLEVFLSRPAQLYSRLLGLVSAVASHPPQP